MYCKSIRDTSINGVDIKENNYIGFTNDKMISSKESLLDTIVDSLEKLDVKDYEIMTLIYGKNFKEEEKEVLNEEIMSLNKRIEVYAIDGLQESYDLVIILE
jgi:hypothetical protein